MLSLIHARLAVWRYTAPVCHLCRAKQHRAIVRGKGWMRVSYLTAVLYRCPRGVVAGNAEVSLFGNVECIQIRVVIDGVAAYSFHINRRTGAVADQQGTVEALIR